VVLDFLCAIDSPSGEPSSEGIGGHSPGALLKVERRTPGLSLELTAMKNSPTRVSRFAAHIHEKRGPMTIDRSVAGVGGPGAFDFDIDRRAEAAAIAPPSPFSGELDFERADRATPRLRGDLAIDFPGRAGVRLVGPGSRASLVRAVQNPGHPFRLPRLAR
jgi:hypothetical protein